jgi:predicted phage terminase large subunit-like protein
LEELVRRTTSFRLHDWQRKHLVPLLESLLSEKGKRILVHGPPQFGKSILVSKRFPAWALGVDPNLRIVIAGYNVTHASAFCEVVRDVMHGKTYRELFPFDDCAIPKNASKEMFSTHSRAELRDGQESLTAVGLLSGFTGKGADILIIDDPYASPDDALSEAVNERVWRWWEELVKVRISDDTNVIVMFHRYHEDDFAGRLLAEGGWTYYRFPAIADENDDGSDPTGRMPGELLSEMRSREFLAQFEQKKPMVWLGQFQGTPRAAEGAFIRRQWLQEVAPQAVPPIKQWVRFWDLATKADQTGDFISGALLGVGPDQTIYLKDICRFRAEWPDAVDIITDVTMQDYRFCCELGADYQVGLEKVAWMRAMTQDLFSRPVFKSIQLTPLPPNGDKKERAAGWVARAKIDGFRIVKGSWNDAFIQECIAFDGHGLTHDDQVDSVSGAYALTWHLRGDLINERREPEVGSLEYYRRLAAENRRAQDDEWNADYYRDEDD